MEKVAIIIRSPASSSLMFALNFALNAATLGLKTRVFFLDWAAEKLRRDKIDELELPPEVAERREWFLQRVKGTGFPGIHKMIEEMKTLGDVKIYVCSLASDIWGLNKENMIPEVDEVRGTLAFMAEDLEDADLVLTF